MNSDLSMDTGGGPRAAYEPLTQRLWRPLAEDAVVEGALVRVGLPCRPAPAPGEWIVERVERPAGDCVVIVTLRLLRLCAGGETIEGAHPCQIVLGIFELWGIQREGR